MICPCGESRCLATGRASAFSYPYPAVLGNAKHRVLCNK
nr:MAG TPA: hypothetical protein [Caudoviricetes sp.]DAS40355.1 MAG TPA: hypothetical protein [Caudoviricetes sp.]